MSALKEKIKINQLSQNIQKFKAPNERSQRVPCLKIIRVQLSLFKNAAKINNNI